MTTRKSCRVCGQGLADKPLLSYSNMPKAAQHFPNVDEIHTESGADLTVCQCTGCGLVQLSDPPVPYFRDVIRASAISIPVQTQKKAQFGGLVERYGLKERKVIEIGCGKGEFLSLWEGLGVRASGLEHAEDSVIACHDNGLDVSQGYIDSAENRLADAPYDAFTLLMFLEHMPDPNGSLSGIRNNMADGAVGLVEVPNFAMMVQNGVFAEFISDHLLYFTRDTLTFTLQMNGFEVLECEEIRDDYVLSAIVKKRSSYDLSQFSDVLEKISEEIQGFIDYFPAGSVAIWGAGHQALSMICLVGIGDKISYVVDSSAFKQGRYTPASHLPIKSPSWLKVEPPAALLIMAGSYSKEIASIAMQDYKITNVAVFDGYRLNLVADEAGFKGVRQ